MSGELFDAQSRIVGSLESVRYQNERGDFCVAVVVDRAQKSCVVVGNLRGASPGERVQLTGEWVRDPRFGRQFKVTDAVVMPPSTAKGIVRYLSSGLIEGVGKVTAKRLVAAFGEETLDVIESQRDRLLDVPGIGPVRQRRILEAWDKQRAVRNVMLFLTANGISPNYAHRIYEKYGDSAVEVVRRHPYRLADDVYGIGFKHADRIARETGIRVDDPARLAAGLAWTLTQSASRGHVFLPRDVLVTTAADVLGVDQVAVEQALDQVVLDGSLISDNDVITDPDRLDQAAVYLARSHAAEVELARRIAAVAATPVSADRLRRWVDAARDAEASMGVSLETNQRRAVEALLGQRIAVLTGGPGTGKTTILKLFADAAAATGAIVLLAAPTGRAAQRMGEATGRPAATLHRLLKFSFSERRFQHNEDNPLEADLVVVDEASMLDQYLARSLMRAIPSQCSVLLVGDADQLPSVGAGNVLHDLLRSPTIAAARLTEVFRQAEQSGIVLNAHRIRRGLAPESTSQASSALRDFYHIRADDPVEARARVLKLVCQRMPSAFNLDPVRDIQVLAPMHKGECGIEALNLALQERLNPKGQPIRFGDREFRVGDKVIQLRNNYHRKVFNGQIGQIEALNVDNGAVVISFDGRPIDYAKSDLHEVGLAYCISIHKSQGSEYPAVVIPLTTQHFIMLQRNLLYTGVTRARRLVCLVGQPKALHRALRNDAPEQRHTGLAARIRQLRR